MKRKWKLDLATAALAALLLVSAAPAGRTDKPSTGLFWKASSAKGTLYLLGSVRLTAKSLYPLPESVESAFERASALIVAVDTGADDLRIDDFMDRNGAYPDGDDVYKHLQPGYANKLRKFASTADLPVENLGSLKPWVILMVTGMWPLISGSKQSGQGMEEHFLQRAKGHKPILQVESAEYQLGLLAAIPDRQQLAILDDSLDHPADPSLGERLSEAWARADSKTIEEEEVGFLARYPEVRHRLLDERNGPMADFADARLKVGGSYFMVVDAAHTLGRDGIVNRLRRMGYRVTAEQS